MKQAFIAAAAALVSFAQAAPTQFPVCIVGAGPAGLTVANRLESQGQKVVVFEKQGTLGGKCQAVYDDNFHPLGALLFTNSTYKNTLKVIEKSGVLSAPFKDGNTIWDYNVTTGAINAEPEVTLAQKAILAAEVARYIAYWEFEFRPVSDVGYKGGVPEKFTVSTAQWLKDHHYKILPVLFQRGMVAYGYGDPAETPILYMLQYFAPDVVLAFAGVQQGYIIDFHKVWTNFATTQIKSPIHLNTTVTKIDRSGDSPSVSFVDPKSGSEATQQCSSLVLAFPPLVSSLKAANLDVTDAETEVFEPVGITNYYSGAIRVDTPAHQLASAASTSPELAPPAVGEPVAFIRLHDNSPIATSWSWDAYRTVPDVAAAKAKLIALISKVNKKTPTDVKVASKPISEADIIGFQQNNYFPHFDAEQLKGDWYGKLDKLQGQKKTFYASGLNGFETVEFAVRAGMDVVDSYVLKKN